MTTPKDTIWSIEPHTLAKHEILRRYLAAWYPIICRYNPHVIYIDGFCGPGRYTGGEPGSPIIALDEAQKHGERLRGNRLTFLFVDERTDRIDHLKGEIAHIVLPENFTVISKAGEFEIEFQELLSKHKEKGEHLAPTFAFIDPFGFKGLPLKLICDLLSNPKTEVFINFMADSINRFLEHPDQQIKKHINDVFGTEEALDIAQTNDHRIEALRLLYQKQLQQCANFVRYFEMRNENDRPIYYLFLRQITP
jgi:three-Cys-motif partner protein